jgi:hypothetical protein
MPAASASEPRRDFNLDLILTVNIMQPDVKGAARGALAVTGL